MNVGFVQFDAVFGAVWENVEKAAGLITGKRADLWVLPELFNTGYKFVSRKEAAGLAEPVPKGPTTQRLIRLAKSADASIVAGLAERDGDRIYNAAVLVGPEGHRATYRKIHLFHEEKQWFTPGDLPFAVHPITYDNGRGERLMARIGIMICFDWIFPESARTLALLGADILCHPANLVLPHCPDAMVTRCLENRLFAVTANRTGVETRGGGTLRYIGRSQITAPNGEILHRATADEAAAYAVAIDPAEARQKGINPHNNLLKDRRPDFYRL